MKRIVASGQRFIDESGNEVIFSGINLVCKDPSKGFVETVDERTFKWFRDCGFNLIRLGLEWEGVEPEPLKYDDHYLSRIAEQIELAQKYGIYVFLDMHQDLYSRLYGNGAPEWATLHDGEPHVTGDVWSDAYLISPAVQRSLDNFWANAKVGDMGLQDYYAKMWGHVVDYMSQYNFTNVIGYDLMNEPSMGSRSEEVVGMLLSAYAQTILKVENPDLNEIATIWFDEGKKETLLMHLSDMEIYHALIQFAGVPSIAFERDILSPFYCKVAREIRKYDQEAILLLESGYFCNMGIESGITAVTDEAGEVDKNQAYVPHGYDLVVDTSNYESYNNDRVKYIFDIHKKTGERLNVPIIIGEWGAFYGNKYACELSKDVLEIFCNLMFGNTYWSYSGGMERSPEIGALKRGYPMTSTVHILNYTYDYTSKKLVVNLATQGEFTLTVFHPNAKEVMPEPNDAIKSFERVVVNENAGYITLKGEREDANLSVVL